jgi:hypothetical protein
LTVFSRPVVIRMIWLSHACMCVTPAGLYTPPMPS